MMRQRVQRLIGSGLMVAAIGITLGVGADQVNTQSGSAGQSWIPADVAQRVERNPPLAALASDPTNRWAESIDAAKFGQLLFFDPRFSASGQVSCATCHKPEHAFSDSKSIARGEGIGTRRSMSILNAAYQRWLTWDGRADTLWSQALQPFETAHEMGFSRSKVMALIASDATLRASYQRAFKSLPPSAHATAAEIDAGFAEVGKAIAAYERKLVTGPSRYDRWWTRRAAGDRDADAELTESERRGLLIFFGSGNCYQCHHGALFSDGEFHMIGAPEASGGMPTDPGRYAVISKVRTDPFNAAGPHSDDPHGRQATISASLVSSPSQWGEFRTPSLRNVALRPPYMHAGQFASLGGVVRFYSTLEGATALDHHREMVLTRLNLTQQEQDDLTAFLGTLTGLSPTAPWNAAPVLEPLAPASAPAARGSEPGGAQPPKE